MERCHVFLAIPSMCDEMNVLKALFGLIVIR
jgi:hypothetical protein